MSREEFLSSSDALYHGGTKPLELKHVFDYRAEEYHREHDGSATLGFGFYATDSREDAEHYSRVRGVRSTERHVATLLPFDARVLDLRAEHDKTCNAPVPRDIAEAWKAAFLAYYHVRTRRDGFVGAIFDGFEDQYAAFLEKALALPAIDLRKLLGTTPDRALGSPNCATPPWMHLFADFMRQQGYDGLVYNEGGEGWQSTVASYVFYNLEKIGTYESWQERD